MGRMRPPYPGAPRAVQPARRSGHGFVASLTSSTLVAAASLAPVFAVAPALRCGALLAAPPVRLVPAAGFEGQEVVTAEGLGTPDALHPVQREMADRGGSQCGYCTPGFVCAMAGEYYRPDRTQTGTR